MKTTKANAPQGPITPVQTGINMAQMTTAANNYLDSLVEEGKFTREEVDAAWEKAKKMANDNKKKDPGVRVTYAYITSLFNSILGVGKQPNRTNASVLKVNAAARLTASVRK